MALQYKFTKKAASSDELKSDREIIYTSHHTDEEMSDFVYITSEKHGIGAAKIEINFTIT